MISLCPTLGKKYALIYQGTCPNHLQKPANKVLPIFFIGVPPYVKYPKDFGKMMESLTKDMETLKERRKATKAEMKQAREVQRYELKSGLELSASTEIGASKPNAGDLCPVGDDEESGEDEYEKINRNKSTCKLDGVAGQSMTTKVHRCLGREWFQRKRQIGWRLVLASGWL